MIAWNEAADSAWGQYPAAWQPFLGKTSLERHTITVGCKFLDCHHIPGANAMALKELTDPATLAEELLLTVEVGHDYIATAPVHDNFALGGRGTFDPPIASAGNFSKNPLR